LRSSATKVQQSKSVGGRALEAPPTKNTLIPCLLLVVATLAFYNPIAHCGFVYSDDVVYVMRNPQVHAG